MLPHWPADRNQRTQMPAMVAASAWDIYNRTQWERVHIFERICDFIWAGASVR